VRNGGYFLLYLPHFVGSDGRDTHDHARK
jgi:hypothetical protein